MAEREAGEIANDLKPRLGQAISILHHNYRDIATVREWATAVGYGDALSFSNDFRWEFGWRPQPVLLAFRSKKAIFLLREGELSNYEIAPKLSLRNEKGLYQFLKNQTGFMPTAITELSDKKFKEILLKNN